MFKFCLLLSVFLVSTVENARILGIFPTPSVSHQIVYQPVLKELSRRGHEIVSVTPNPMRDPSLQNYTEIYMHMAYEFWVKTFNFTLGRELGHGAKENTYDLFEGNSFLCEEILNMAEITQMINNPNEHFDLVIVEWTLCPGLAMFSHRFQAPLVGIISLHAFSTLHDMVGNPTHPVHQPDFFLRKANNLNFRQRLYSIYYCFWFRWYYNYQVVPKEDAIARKYFGNDIPYLANILNNLSFLFTNTHPILSGPRPLVPTTLAFGGTGVHIKEPKPLPKDLLKFLDEATEGVIYFSLGSNVKSSDISEEKRKAILAAFSDMPYKILWKWETDSMPGLPNNVKLSKWFPQQDVLGHPNIKLFITQGGIQSLEEAIRYRVPLVGIPFFADQDYNVDKVVYLGIGVCLELNTLTKEDLTHAVYTVIKNTSYKERITKIADTIYDQPIKSLDHTVWWMEYVIRHNGTKELRSPAIDSPFYIHFHLDVLLFLLVVTIVFLLFIYKLYMLILPIVHNSMVNKLKIN